MAMIMAMATAQIVKRRGSSEPMSLDAGTLTRRLLVVAAMLSLMWLAVTVGISGIARVGNPELALWWVPKDSRALSNLADRILIEKQTAATLKRAAELSRAAIKVDPTNVVAMRILGFAQPEAQQPVYFAYANKLSKRDLATQLWLIENQVGRGNAREALTHYDAALRTSEYAPALLFPILSAASEDRELAPEIAKALAKKPDWAEPFLYELVNSAPSADTLTMIFETVKKAGTVLPPALTDNLMRRILRDYRFDLMRRSYFVAGGKNANIGRSVNNGSFSVEPQFLPLDWAFTADEKIFAGRLSVDGAPNDYRMVVQVSDGVAGEAVRQLLLLAPGGYRLEAKSGNIPTARDARVVWRMMCADKADTKIGDMLLSQAGEADNITFMDFDVPKTGCSGQWITLRVTSQTDGDGVDAWIDNVSIVARSRAEMRKDGDVSPKGT